MPGRVLRTEAGRLRLGWRLLAFVVVALCVTVALGLVLPPHLVSGSLALLVGSCVAGWMLLASEGRAAPALGFHLSPEGGAELATGLGLGLGVAGVAVAGLWATGAVGWAVEAGTVSGWLGGAGTALLVLAVPAAAEEALLRGYPLQALAEAWGVGRALLVTSAAFALAHLGNPGITALAVLNIGLAGLWLGLVWVRTGSLWWATGAHLGWNWGSAYVADLPVSGLELFDAPFYEAFMSGPEWLGGGAFGPEGSVLATLTMGAASWWCWKTDRLRASETVVAAKPLVAVGPTTRQTKEFS